MKCRIIPPVLTVLLAAALLGGCGQPQLEERAFPLALAVAPSDEQGMYGFSFFFEDTALADAAMYHKDNCCVTGRDYADAYEFFSHAQAAEPDDRQMQAIILSERLLSDQEFLRDFISDAVTQHHFSWNTRIYLVGDGAGGVDVQALSDGTGAHVGTYLSDIAENMERHGEGSVPTVGALYQELFDHEGELAVPLLQQGDIVYVKGWRTLPEFSTWTEK